MRISSMHVQDCVPAQSNLSEAQHKERAQWGGTHGGAPPSPSSISNWELS